VARILGVADPETALLPRADLGFLISDTDDKSYIWVSLLTSEDSQAHWASVYLSRLFPSDSQHVVEAWWAQGWKGFAQKRTWEVA
jgi:predicted transcriptional regulator